MTFLRSRRGAVLVGAAVLLGLFLFRPGVGRLKDRVANAIGGALQRQVEIGSVHVRLLPRPGFDLDDFVVHDDPAFSAEPVVRAPEVTASVRLLPLLRGHLEVSRLSLTEPSLNLVRNSEGHWNLESLLEHARQTPVAPTNSRRPVGRPAFPYIEADHGRINFKLESEKKPFALTDADYSFWQDSDSSWAMRLKAQPMRTDLSLSDTGELRVNGTWQRADSLRNTPVQFSIQWEKAQLGQVTKFVSGSDRGWRATVRVDANLSGTPGSLLVDSRISLSDFRRYDIMADSDFMLRTHCTSHYSSIDRGFHEVNCVTPVGNGSLSINGNIARTFPPAQYALTLNADKVPMSAVLALARRAKADLPQDLQAAGTVAGSFEATAKGEGSTRSVVFQGRGSTDGFALNSVSSKIDLQLDRLPITVVPGGRSATRGSRKLSVLPGTEPESAHLVVGPLRIDHATPLTLQAYVWRQGYVVSVAGDSNVQHLLRSARAVGLSVPQPAADGAAKVDLQIAGTWTGFAPPKITGLAQLKSLRIELHGLSSPVEVNAAAVSLKPDRTDVQNISASIAGGHWTGSLSLPRPCSTLPNCPITFNLQTDLLSTERLGRFVNSSRAKPWYGFLTADSSAGPAYLSRLNTSGRLTALQLTIHGLTANHVSANFAAQNGVMRLSDLRADTLGGKHHGKWEVDFNAKPPRYSGEGTFDQVSLKSLSSAMHSDWISGRGNARYQVRSSGSNFSDLVDAASGTLQIELQDGELTNVVLSNGPLHVEQFSGAITLQAGKYTMADGSLETPSASYTVSGTASRSGELNFKLVRDKHSSLDITGTLDEPHVLVVHAPSTEAALQH